MLPVERVIGEEGLMATVHGLCLAMRLPWYRSLPFSTVEIASLSIDGKAVALDGVRVQYDAQSWTLSELGEQTNAFWFVRDSAYLLLPDVQMPVGSCHMVVLSINVNPPYIPGMKRVNTQVAELTVNAGAAS